jgi:hypothetical protein
MQDQLNTVPAPKRVPWNKGTAATQTCLVDPDKAPDRRPCPRPGHVQSGNR